MTWNFQADSYSSVSFWQTRPSGVPVASVKTNTSGEMADKLPLKKHQKLYANRKAAGLCVQCGKNPPENRTLKCKSCKDKNKKYPDYRNKHRQERIDAGICTHCGKATPLVGHPTCERCSAMLAKNRTKHHERKRAWCRGNGICTVCCKRPVQPAVRKEGLTATCAWCYDRNQEYKAKHKKHNNQGEKK